MKSILLGKWCCKINTSSITTLFLRINKCLHNINKEIINSIAIKF